MKIEIAESLVLSWLRHVQGCVVTQMNWKPSPSWPISEDHALRQRFERIRALAGETIAVPIFKQGEFAQFIGQAEIDVLGVRFPHDAGTAQAIAVDSAFHEGGLNYGSADETVGRVLKKLVRAALALEGYLNVREAMMVFATPKIAEPIRAAIEHHLAGLEAALADGWSTGLSLRFRLIANQDFADEIVQPVLDMADEVAKHQRALFARAAADGALRAARPSTSAHHAEWRGHHRPWGGYRCARPRHHGQAGRVRPSYA
jgi:hypothetical protein